MKIEIKDERVTEITIDRVKLIICKELELSKLTVYREVTKDTLQIIGVFDL